MISVKKKLELPDWWIKENERVQRLKEESAKSFWELSQMWNCSIPATIMDAFEKVNEIKNIPEAPSKVIERTSIIESNLINFGTKAKWKKSCPNNQNIEPQRMTLL